MKAALDAFGRLDILVNNAGIDQHAALHNISLDDFERVFAVNFYGTLYVTKAPCTECTKGMIQKGISRVVCPPIRQSSRWAADQEFGRQLSGRLGIKTEEFP